MTLSAVLVGCGGDGGEPDAPAPTATPPPAVATVTPQPTPTATPARAFDEVVLGVGYAMPVVNEDGTRPGRPMILRNDGEGWTAVPLAIAGGGAVYGVTFSTAAVAWAYGEGAGALLLRSDDAGRTWTDVSAVVSEAGPRIAEMGFRDAETGYLVASGFFGGGAMLATRDGGRSWQAPAVSPIRFYFLTAALGFRAGASELARYDSFGLSVVRLDDASLPAVELAPSGGASLAGPNAVVTAGSFGWIAEWSRAAILRSAAPGEPWLQQSVAVEGTNLLHAIDVRDVGNGVAGGFTIPLTEYEPLALRLDADGATWRPAAVADVPSGWTILDVLRLRGDGGVAVATDFTSGRAESMLLRSDDGGRSWRRDPTPFEHGWQIFDLARNTERP